MRKTFTLTLTLFCIAAIAQSPYISKVYEFVPAPGQFINTLPAYSSNESYQDVLAKVNNNLVGKKNGTMICLGSFGGYVVVGFDHSIVNKNGEKDFAVYGNTIAGSAEPGVIEVMADENGNGLPDDTWYEIAGSEYNKSIHNYEITYYKPSAQDDAATVAIEKYIRWTDNLGGEGYLPKNVYHKQSYYPGWITEDSYTLKGSKLPGNGKNTSETGQYWVLSSFDYGYADNVPNTDEKTQINIDWAVNPDGTPANLTSIDFIKVYTGELQVCGWLGETSTEFTGIEDLHPTLSSAKESNEDGIYVQRIINNTLEVIVPSVSQIQLLSITGRPILSKTINEGHNTFDTGNLPNGIYILSINNKHIYKLIKF